MRLSRRGFIKLILAAAGFLALGDVFREAAFDLAVEELSLPGGPGLKVGLVSDIHFTSSAWWPSLRSSIDELRSSKPDLIALTGDLVSSKEGWPGAVKYVEELLSIAPVFVVWGNHDHWHLEDLRSRREELERAGAKVLVNECAKFEDVWVIGVDDPYTGHSDVSRALSSAESSSKVLLAHSPQVIGEAKGKVDLILAGHTHGGQVVLPLVGPLFIPLPPRYRKYVSGLYRSGNTSLYVTRGLGTVFLPVRLNCPPEVTIIEW